MINEKNICSNPNCIWELKENDVFCGLCGLATANIHVAVEIQNETGTRYHPLSLDEKNIEGLFFYHGSNIEQQQVLCFVNTGKRPIQIELETTSYILEILYASFNVIKLSKTNNMSFSLASNYTSSEFNWTSNDEKIIQNALRIKIKSKHFTSSDREVLKLKTVLYKTIKEIPLIDSESPIWALHVDQTIIRPDDRKYLDIYPLRFDPNYIWKCELKTDRGAAILEGIEIKQRNTQKSEVRIIYAEDLPKTIFGYQSKSFELSWVKNNQNMQPKKISLIFYIRNQEPLEIPLIIHATPPIDIKCDYLKENDNPYVIVGEGINTSFKLKLENIGTAQAQLRNIVINNTNVKLTKAEILLDQKAKQEIDCSSQVVLATQVQNAYLINETHKGFSVGYKNYVDTTKHKSFSSHVKTEVSVIHAILPRIKDFIWSKGGEPFKIEKKSEFQEIANQDHHVDTYVKAYPILAYLEFQLFNLLNVLSEKSYTIDMRLIIQPIASDRTHLGNLKEIKLSIDIPIAPVAQAEYILIDYGTVNTCVKIKKQANTFSNHVVKLDEKDEVHPEEMKSTYLIKRFHANQNHDVKFGLEVWESLEQHIISTDWAAKLRLGTEEKRLLKDERNSIRFISGSDATTLFLKEVLIRVKKYAGSHFSKIYLSSPAAFNQSARKDLAKSLLDLGFTEDDGSNQKNTNQVQFKFLLTEPEAYLCHLITDENFCKSLFDYKPSEPDKPILGFVFDFGGGTTDITLFEFDVNQGVSIIHSFGYRWLGGEAVTQYIAQLIYDQISEKTQYPFPQIDILKRSNVIDTLVDKTTQEINNFGEIRRKAEMLKCQHDEVTKEIEFQLLNQSNESKLIKLNTNIVKPIVEKELKKLLSEAINDIFFRIQKMNESHHVCKSFPEIICMAGNSSRLWFMKDLIHERFEDIGVKKPLYHFDPDFTKTGVVNGLENMLNGNAWRDIPPPEIKELDPHWWYIKIGLICELILPSGAPLNVNVTDEDLDANQKDYLKFLLSSEYLSLWQSEYAMEKSKNIEDASKFSTHWRVPIPNNLKLKKISATIRFINQAPVLFFKTCNLRGDPTSGWMSIPAEEYQSQPL